MEAQNEALEDLQASGANLHHLKTPGFFIIAFS
jgi:hypothetical protein